MILSVRLMTYNHAAFIDAALEGINSQKVNFDVEVVVGDDFSSDNTLQKVKNFKFTNPNLTIKILERKQGDAYSIQRKKQGRLYNFIDIINHCQGKYIALLDGDDYWTDPLKLQKQVDFLEVNEDVAICFHRANMLKNEALELHQIPKEFENKAFKYIELLKHYNFITTASVVFRKPDSFDFPDWFFKLPFGDLGLYKLVSKNKYLCALPDVMSVYRIHDGGMWSSLGQVNEQNIYLKFYKNIYEALDNNEKQIVNEKIKITNKKIATLKFPENKILKNVYLKYLLLKK